MATYSTYDIDLVGSTHPGSHGASHMVRLPSGTLWAVFMATADDSVNVAYSDDGGLTWSSPESLYVSSGYNWINLGITMDRAGNPVVFFVADDAGGVKVHIWQRASGIWGSTCSFAITGGAGSLVGVRHKLFQDPYGTPDSGIWVYVGCDYGGTAGAFRIFSAHSQNGMTSFPDLVTIAEDLGLNTSNLGAMDFIQNKDGFLEGAYLRYNAGGPEFRIKHVLIDEWTFVPVAPVITPTDIGLSVSATSDIVSINLLEKSNGDLWLAYFRITSAVHNCTLIFIERVAGVWGGEVQPAGTPTSSNEYPDLRCRLDLNDKIRGYYLMKGGGTFTTKRNVHLAKYDGVAVTTSKIVDINADVYHLSILDQPWLFGFAAQYDGDLFLYADNDNTFTELVQSSDLAVAAPFAVFNGYIADTEHPASEWQKRDVLVRTLSGRLWSAHSTGNGRYYYAIYSDDNGVTWSAPELIWDSGAAGTVRAIQMAGGPIYDLNEPNDVGEPCCVIVDPIDGTTANARFFRRPDFYDVGLIGPWSPWTEGAAIVIPLNCGFRLMVNQTDGNYYFVWPKKWDGGPDDSISLVKSIDFLVSWGAEDSLVTAYPDTGNTIYDFSSFDAVMDELNNIHCVFCGVADSGFYEVQYAKWKWATLGWLTEETVWNLGDLSALHQGTHPCITVDYLGNIHICASVAGGAEPTVRNLWYIRSVGPSHDPSAWSDPECPWAGGAEKAYSQIGRFYSPVVDQIRMAIVGKGWGFFPLKTNLRYSLKYGGFGTQWIDGTITDENSDWALHGMAREPNHTGPAPGVPGSVYGLLVPTGQVQEYEKNVLEGPTIGLRLP